MTDAEVVKDYTENFETWINDFNEWQTRIGFDPSWLGDYRFDIKFDWDTAGETIEFGDFAGKPKWDRRMQIPQQTVRDAIISMVSVQGDTASCRSKTDDAVRLTFQGVNSILWASRESYEVL